MRLPRLHLRSTALALTGLLTVVVAAPAFQQTQVLWTPIVPWGLTLQTDRIYYGVGDTMDARFVIANYTGQAAWGWAPVRGGNGCTYSYSIADPFGQELWVPGSVVNGTYQGPGCLFAETNTLHAPGTTRRVPISIPLIYQNPGGFGVQGLPLPPGGYELRVRVTFAGPKRTSGSPTGPGSDFSATVPFRIE